MPHSTSPQRKDKKRRDKKPKQEKQRSKEKKHKDREHRAKEERNQVSQKPSIHRNELLNISKPTSRPISSMSSHIIPCVSEEIVPRQWTAEYKSGRMDDVVQFLTQKGIKREDYLKSGSTCIVFNYGPKHVLKLTTKGICYFRHFASSVNHFQDLISTQFNNHFLPVNEILYEDNYYFVYIQEKLRILDLPEIDEKIYIKILDIVKQMCISQIITPDIISCNLGFPLNNTSIDVSKNKNTRLLLLDYHDLTPFDVFVKKKKWTKIFNCLLNFATYMIYKKSFEEQFKQSLCLWKDEINIKKKDFASEYFPAHVVEVWRTLATGQPEAIKKAIIECQKKLETKQ